MNGIIKLQYHFLFNKNLKYVVPNRIFDNMFFEQEIKRKDAE
tara:strand:+ start:5247 stop:5372 length:126 start_codon:yes stop_codon:yes gene_type:complete